MRPSTITALALSFLTTTTTALTLQDNFQALTVKVSSSCKTAYSQTIPGCTESDFQNSNKCSSSCLDGLKKVEQAVNSACQNVVVDPSTLLGRVFQRQTQASLCPNNFKSAASSSTKGSAGSSTSSGSGSSSSTASSTSSASSAAAVVSTTTQTAASTTTTTTKTATPTPAAGRFGLSGSQQQIAALAKSGGGSPFDIVGYTGSGNRLVQYGVGMMVGGTALVVAGFYM
jgi:hypothetical protein